MTRIAGECKIHVFLRRVAKLSEIICTSRLLWALIRTGVAASTESGPFLRRISPDLILDVGANCGQFSLAARKWHPRARIIAFEPLTAPAGRYTRFFRRDNRVTLYRVALSSSRGDAEMHVAREDDSSSLLPFSDLQLTYYPGTGEVGREKVKTAPITDFVTEKDFTDANLLKIDVQGAELDVLKSAEPILQYIDWIYVEASFLPLYRGQPLARDVVNFLERRDFAFSGMFNVSFGPYCGSVVQADFLFINTMRRTSSESC